MKFEINIEELIARPLDVIARLKVDLQASTENDPGDDSKGGAVLTAAISEALCSGASPALDKVPVLSRQCLAEVCLLASLCTAWQARFRYCLLLLFGEDV